MKLTEAQKKKAAKTAAEKIDRVMEIAGDLTDHEVAVLQESKTHVEQERDQYRAVGMLFEPGSAEARLEMFAQGLARIDHLLGLRECMIKKQSADVKYAAETLGRRKIAGL